MSPEALPHAYTDDELCEFAYQEIDRADERLTAGDWEGAMLLMLSVAEAALASKLLARG